MFQGCTPAESEDGIITDANYRHNPEDVYRQDDAESVSSDDSETPGRNPPCWTWGRFYHEDELVEFYFWQVGPGYFPRSWRTHIWTLTRRDGEVVYVTSNRDRERALVMEPPEELLDDWHSSAGDKIEPTHHAGDNVRVLIEPEPNEVDYVLYCTAILSSVLIFMQM